MEDKKKRGPRTSQAQYEIYVNFIKTYKELRFLKLNAENSERFEEIWSSLTTKLNSCGSGATKTKEEWKRVIIFVFIILVILGTFIYNLSLYIIFVLDIYRVEKFS